MSFSEGFGTARYGGFSFVFFDGVEKKFGENLRMSGKGVNFAPQKPQRGRTIRFNSSVG